jgi:hypothetical protein
MTFPNTCHRVFHRFVALSTRSTSFPVHKCMRCSYSHVQKTTLYVYIYR